MSYQKNNSKQSAEMLLIAQVTHISTMATVCHGVVKKPVPQEKEKKSFCC